MPLSHVAHPCFIASERHFLTAHCLSFCSSPESAGDALLQKQNKKRKRKKPKLPKNYNPKVAPDPERWLPRRERSTFKQRKRRRNEPMKGTQGGPSAQSDL